MNYVNRVDLQGIVGTIKEINSDLYRFNLCINETYTTDKGDCIITQQWFTINAPKNQVFGKLEKGSCVYVTGKLTTVNYTVSDGTSYSNIIINANKVGVKNNEN